MKLINLPKVALPVLALATASIANAEECKNPEALRFSMIPTEETTQEFIAWCVNGTIIEDTDWSRIGGRNGVFASIGRYLSLDIGWLSFRSVCMGC